MSGVRFNYFAIYGAMRTGSNLLEQNLNQYDGITCHGELFNPTFIGKAGQEDYLGIDLPTREVNPDRLIAQMIDRADGDLPGFRIFQGHDQRVFRSSLNDENCAKIILRRTPLDSFVSLKIARATDQWILGNAPKRRSEVISFDVAEYREYLTRLAEYESELRVLLQSAGQTAFELRYEDLKSIDVMNGLATYLGIAQRRDSFDEKIKRQNPEPLSEKVSNYEQMVDALAMLGQEVGHGDHAPLIERNAGVRDTIVCRHAPVLFAPVPGVDALPALNMMAQFDQADPAELKTGMNQKELAHWLENSKDLISFSVVDHPLERAYCVYMSHIFPPDGTPFPKIRRRLQKHFDVDLPDNLDGWTLEKHALAFERFLVFLKMNLAGQTGIRIDANWEAQHKLVARIVRVLPIGRVIRRADFSAEMKIVAEKLGKPFEPTSAVDRTQYELKDIYTRRLENLARASYAKDYRMFGFADWQA